MGVPTIGNVGRSIEASEGSLVDNIAVCLDYLKDRAAEWLCRESRKNIYIIFFLYWSLPGSYSQSRAVVVQP